MTNEGDVNTTSTTNVRQERGKKNRKGKKHQKGNEKILLDPTPSEALTSYPPSTIKASDDELGEEDIDVTFLPLGVSNLKFWPKFDCGQCFCARAQMKIPSA
ncbi:hypothetical protein H5410_023008 [Solanum commersonii]|uniref:Uncharacterized protein n=1 Tax=Solanum commersonii TaxID=4109 RepID=A0A9J5ZIA0_SOLCO|nr:hypothetical protein H5410_023008 [Solanum commersonii]